MLNFRSEFFVRCKEGMSALLISLDLANFRCLNRCDTLRAQFSYVSRLLRKLPGSSDDSFLARNLWPCRHSQCAAVLGPLDVIVDEPKTVSEMYMDDRCCSVCGTFRREVDVSIVGGRAVFC